MAAAPDFSSDVAAVGKQYPALLPYLGNVRVQYGTASSPTDDRQLEFYPPWESNNPNPGAVTLELFKRDLQGPALQSAIAGDMLHLLGSTDPRTGQAIDPRWLAFKQQLIAARSPQHQQMDQGAYEDDKKQGEAGSFDDWMMRNRADAYIRGYITPDVTDEWRKQGVYTPELSKVLDGMKGYLTTPPVQSLFTAPPQQSPVLDLLKRGGK